MKYQEPITPRRKRILISIRGQQSLLNFSKLSKRKISAFKLQRESTLFLIEAREKEVSRTITAQPSDRLSAIKARVEELVVLTITESDIFDEGWTLEQTPRHRSLSGTSQEHRQHFLVHEAPPSARQ